MATYVNNLRLTELATGEGSGTWGTTTNTSLELIGEALGYNTQNCFASDADATTTVADGVSDPARAMYFKVTSSATLTATRTLTIAPNTLSRVMFIENATTGSQSIAISQGSGANVTIATGKTAVVYLDGAGSTAAVVDAMAGVDPGITDTLAEVLVAGNTTGGTSLVVSSGDDVTFTGASANIVFDSSDSALEFADNAKAIFGAGSDLQIYHDGTNSVVGEVGTGNLYVQSNGAQILLQPIAGEQGIVVNSNSSVGIYYDNALRLATTSTGIDVTGTIVGDGLDLTVGTNDRTLLREFNSSNNLSSVNAANSAFRPFSISALGTNIQYGGTSTLATGDNLVNLTLNSGSISHGFAYNENGGEIALYDETGTAATLLDQANNNTRLLELVNGSNIQVGLGGSNTTGSLIFTKASGVEFGRITGSGFMGLNNPDPDTTLHIGNISATNATHQGRIKLEEQSSSLNTAGGLEFVTSAFGSGYGWKINSVDSAGVHLDFGTRQNSTTWSNSVRFMGDGRVAIGDTTTNSVANRLKVKASGIDGRIAMSTYDSTGLAKIEAQVQDYWSGSTFIGTGIGQYGSTATGTTAGLSNANLGSLSFQNTSAALIYTNGGTPIHFATASTNRMTLDASGNLGIGTATFTDSYKTIIEGSDQETANLTDAGTHGATLFLRATGEGVGSGGAVAFGTTNGNQRPFAAIKGLVNDGTANSVGDLAFAMRNATGDTALTTRMTLTQEGYLGIGEANPTHRLEIEGGSLGTTSGDSISIFNSAFRSSNLDNIEFTARRTSNGTDWQTAAQRIQRKVDTTLMGYMQFGNNDTDLITFGEGVTEYMRIDGSGNLLVGKTATGIGTVGAELKSTGELLATVNNDACAFLNRKSSDGDIVVLRKDGTAVGSLSSRTGSSLIISSAGNTAGIQFGGSEINPVKNGALSDNTIDLGQLSFRFNDIFATNGTIQTSDRNEKQDIEALSDAEQRVAVAAKGLLRKFRWIDAVEEKGDDARIHFGIIAQDLQDAFTAEGLDAGRYAMFINSTWTDEETGEERSRMGVRYSELLAFIISAI